MKKNYFSDVYAEVQPRPLRKGHLINEQRKSFEWLLLILMALGAFSVQAQNAVITGTVVDGTDGTPLPGVTVLVKGTSQGTSTDIEGNYRLQVSEETEAFDAVLVFSFVGFRSEEVSILGKTTIDVSLQEDLQSLNEIIVVGYGTKEKKEVTAAISQISSKDINKSSAISVANSLAGRVPGLVVSQQSGEPGRDDATILVRGLGTTGVSAPLIVVDGIANRDGISRIDPNDIESITVLKDASAAIYGAQAANGVILVTTKRGTEGAPKVNYSFRQGFVSPTRKLDLADAELYARSVNTWNKQANGADVNDIFSDSQINDYANGTLESTDWIEEVYKNYSVQNRHSVSVRGGNEKVKYFVSAGTAYQNGLIKEDETTKFRQYNVRSNIDASIGDRLNFQLDLAYRNENSRWLQYSDQTLYSNTIRAMPTIPATVQGMPARGREATNPLAIAEGPGYLNLKRNVFQGTLKGSYDIPGIKGLAVDGFIAVDKFDDFEKHFFQRYDYYEENDQGELVAVPAGPNQQSTFLKEDYLSTTSVTMNGRIKYENSFGDHNLNAFLAYEQNETNTETFFAQVFNYQSSQIDQLFAGSASSDDFQVGGAGSELARINYFGRFSYDYKSKYLVQFHFRRDGSSKFPDGKRFGFFPGVSLGWRIADEAFFNNSVVSNLKLRASWGQLGNDQVDAFQHVDIYENPAAENPGERYVLGGSGNGVLYPGVAANSAITWETKTTWDIGVDAGFWGDRLTMEFDVFFESREDILTTRNSTVPVYTGLSLPDENIGKINNKGFEAMISYRNSIGELQFNVGANMTYARSEVIDLDERDLYETEEDYNRRSQEGHVIGAPLLYEFVGVYRTQEDLNTYPSAYDSLQFGDPIFADLNGDGVINSDDRKRYNTTQVPQIQYGIPINLNYKNLDFSLLLQGQAKVKKLLRYTFNNGNNGFTYFLENTWSEENPTAKYPAYNRANADNLMSTLWLRDASFLRVRTIEIGYTLPAEFLSRVGIESLRVYANTFNLITFDKFKKDGLPDPETVNLEGWQYPLTRSVNFGLNLSF